MEIYISRRFYTLEGLSQGHWKEGHLLNLRYIRFLMSLLDVSHRDTILNIYKAHILFLKILITTKQYSHVIKI